MSRALSVLTIVALTGLPSVPAWAQDGDDEAESGAAILRGAAEAGLGGPQSVGAQLEEDAAQRYLPAGEASCDEAVDLRAESRIVGLALYTVFGQVQGVDGNGSIHE